MPLASPRYPFTQAAVRGAPEDPGVYALYQGDALLCIGVALGRGGDDTIRGRLLAHFEGAASPSGATHYKWEITSDPLSRRAQYLRLLGPGVLACEKAGDAVSAAPRP